MTFLDIISPIQLGFKKWSGCELFYTRMAFASFSGLFLVSGLGVFLINFECQQYGVLLRISVGTVDKYAFSGKLSLFELD